MVVMLWLGCYLAGAIPFAYLIAKLHGINLHAVGSGNIGATNVSRALGRKWGVLAFVLDFLKGVMPVVCILPVARLIQPDYVEAFSVSDLTRVVAGTFALIGHIFPVFLRFRGGKGVATGSGVGLALMPIPGVIAFGVWLLVAAVTRYVSVASIAAAITMMSLRLTLTPDPFSSDNWLITLFCLAAASFIIVKHRSNLMRLWQGTESKIGSRSAATVSRTSPTS